MIAIQTSERNGKLVGAVLVDERDEIMLISTAGVMIRTSVKDIREMGRSTQGVTLINLDEGTMLAGVERIGETEDENGANAAGADGAEVEQVKAEGAAESAAPEASGESGGDAGTDDAAGGDKGGNTGPG